jgi:IS5 family transposase
MLLYTTRAASHYMLNPDDTMHLAIEQANESFRNSGLGNISLRLVHTAGVTTGKVHDAKVMHRLIREDDRAVYGDKGYASDAKKRAAEGAGVLWAVKEKAKPGRELTKRQRARNRRFGKVRAKVEHIFRVLKCQFGYRKVRYRGLDKNGAQLFALFALANIFLARSRLASA